MIKRLSGVALAATVMCGANGAEAQGRADVNFAFGGAATNDANATVAFASQSPDLAAMVAAVQGAGLDFVGLSQQLEFAIATLNDVDGDDDLFWVYAGVNNYLMGGQDPQQAAGDIVAALTRLYDELGARRFVVPNMISLGDLPLFGQLTPEEKAGLDGLTQWHNATVAGALAAFQASHPDANVISVDAYSVFKGYTADANQDGQPDGPFPFTTVPCDLFYTAIAPDPSQLAYYADPANAPYNAGGCAPFLFMDFVHPGSAAWAPVAQLVVDALAGEDVDRIITLGDSFSDVGSLSDTVQRGAGATFPPLPFTEGRFSESYNLVQQVEALAGVEVSTTPFRQPLRASETFTDKGDAAASGNLYVPKALTGSAAHCGAKVKLRFRVPHEDKPGKTRSIKCEYRYDGEGQFDLHRCQRSVAGGDLLRDVSRVTVHPKGGTESVTVDWLIAP